jgi:transposase InsO family protein
MTESIQLPHQRKLRGEENYINWTKDLADILASRGLLDHIIKEKAEAMDQDDEKWTQKDAKSKLLIKDTLDTQALSLVMDQPTALAMYNHLRKYYQSDGFNLGFNYIVSMNRFQYEDYSNIKDYIIHFNTLMIKLKEANLDLKPRHYIINFIAGLTNSFPQWAERQRSNSRLSATAPTLAQLQEDITDESLHRAEGTADDHVALYGQSKQKQGSRTSRTNKNQQRKYCNHCQKQGHLKEDCWILHPEKKKDFPKNQRKARAKGKQDQNEDQMVATAISGMISQINPTNTMYGHWLFDTGASNHICNNVNLFTSYEPNKNTLPCITTANGIVSPSGKGEVKLRVSKEDGSSHNIVLKDVIHLPSSPINLFSGTAINKYALYYCGKTNTIRYNNNDKEGLALTRSNNLLYIKLGDEGLERQQDQQAFPAIIKPTLSVWHRRLGHLGYENVKRTATMTTGIELDEREDTPEFCRPCVMSKSMRTVSRKPQERATNTFDLIHLDVLGPITPIGYNGHRWALFLTDDHARYRWGYTFKEKGEAYSTIVNFITMAQTQYNKTIRRFRMDGGKEFGGTKLLNILINKGIQLEVTAPYTPEQDGVAERFNRTLLEKVRSLVEDKSIPQTLWPEFLIGMIHIINRTATTTVHQMTPFQAFESSNKGTNCPPPSISHLRVLGCKAYVHIQKERRVSGEKLNPRAEQGTLVGFEGTSIYRIWLPNRNGITRSSTVVFDESDTPTTPEDANPTELHIEPPIPEEINSERIQQTNTEPEDRGVEEEEEENSLQQQTPDVENEQHTQLYTDPATESETAPRRRGRPRGTNYRPRPVERDYSAEPSEEEQQTELDTQQPVVIVEKRNRGRPKGSKNKLLDGIDQPGSFDMSQGSSTRTTRQYRTRSQHDQSNFLSISDEPELPSSIQAYIAEINKDVEEPATYSQAVKGPHALLWQKAMEEEMDSLKRNNTWKVIKPTEHHKVLKGKWVYKIKRDQDGQVNRHKARWVVKGFEQRYGLDYDQTFAGVAKGMAYKTIFALAAHNNWEIEQMDVVTAFLQGTIDTDIYVELPHGFESKGKACKLLKALYGLKQSPRLWQTKLQEVLGTAGYYPLHTDHCVYHSKDSGIILITYVDDFLLVGPDKTKIQLLKDFLNSRFNMKDLGACSHFLGIRITRDRKERTIHLTQDTYILKVLNSFQMENCKPVASPLECGSLNQLVPYDSIATEKELKQYQSAIGCLMYAMIQTRPDLAFSVSALSRFSHNPGPAHWNAVQRVFRYLSKTRNLGITYKGQPGQLVNIHGYSDADYAGDISTRKSTTGFVFFMADGPISWKSARQAAVTLSTTEAEYYGYTSASKEAKWLRNLLQELGYTGEDLQPMVIHGDNQSAMKWSENPEQHQRSKHVDIQYHYVRGEVAKGSVALQYTPTAEMAADGLTKPLTAQKHHGFLEQLRMI